MKLFSRTTLKRAAIIALAAVFGFSNIVSFLLYRVHAPELARQAAIPEARAAVKSFYFQQDVSPLAGNWIMFDGIVPDAASVTTSISQSPAAANHTIIKPGVTSTTTGTPGTVPNGFGWFSNAGMTGTFASGAWTFRVRKADNRASVVGHPVFQVFRVPQNTSLTGAVRLFSFDATATDWWTGATASITYTSTAVGPFALANEYLYIEVWDHETSVNVGKILNFIVEGSELADTDRTKVTTPDFAVPATTTLGNGTDPGNTAIAPGGTATMADAFTFATNTGTDSVTAAVVGLAAGASGGLSLVEITNDAGTIVHGSVANPASDTPSITLGTAISVTTTATQYKIRITPKTHANMPAPAGSTYSVTAKINSWTGTNTAAGTDTAGTTVTIDNLSPGNVTATSGAAGNAQVTLNYTTPADTDLNSVIILRNTVAITATPTEGATYIAGDPVGADAVGCIDATVAVSTADSCIATGLTNGTAYHFKIFVKDANGNYSATGVVPTGSPFTPTAPAATLTISITTGSKVATKSSGALDQYAHDIACTGAAACAAFTLAAAGGTVNVTSIKITETGTAAANTELSDLNLYYDTDGNWADAGAETLFGAAATFAADQTATVTGTLAISAGATAYIYVRYDLQTTAPDYPRGGATINFQIAAATDVVSDGTESGSGALAGTQTVLPNVTSITSYPDATQLGGKVGQTLTLAGAGFGTTCSVVGGNKVSIGAYDLSCTSAVFTNTTISIPLDSGINVYGGTGANGLLVTIGGTADDARQEYHILPSINQVNTPSVSNAARIAENITLTNSTATAAKFGATQGTVAFTGNFGSVSASIVSWGDTSITVTVPSGISSSVYLGDITITRAADANSKTATAYGGNTFRVLPRITLLTPDTGANGASTTIDGDHLCQPSGTCQTAATWNTTADDGNDVKWGATNATVTGTPGNTQIIANAPTLTDGAYSVAVTSGGGTPYTSNGLTFTISNNTLTVGVAGTQTTNITRGTNNNYLGGSVTFTTSTSAATVTSIKISDTGTIVANNNVNNVKIYGDTGGSVIGTYEPGLDTQIGTTQATFAADETVTFSGLTLSVNTAAVYVYAVVDIDADPTSGQTIEIQITNPSTNVVVTSASNSDTIAKAITGTTTVANPNMTVAATGSQIANLTRGSAANYVGGSFTLTMASAIGSLTSFAITENGTVNSTGLLNVKIYGDTGGSVIGTYEPGLDTQIGTTQSFTIDKATFGGLSVSLTTSATYIYAVFDVDSAATAAQTIEIRVAASGDVIGTGFNVSGTFPLDITGTTTIQDPSLTVSASGTQNTNLNSGATAQNIGGSFTVTLSGSTGTLNSLVISEMGTVTASTGLTNITIQSDTDGTFPGTAVTGCTGLSFSVGQQLTCTPTGGLSLNTTARHIYIVVDLASSATGGETIEVQVTNPSTDVSVTGATNTDTVAKNIAGTTTILPNVTAVTSYPDATQLGGKVGQTLTLAGAGFGTTCSVVGGNKVSIGAYDLSCTSAVFTNTTISIPLDSGINVYGGTGASGLLVTIGSTADDARQEYHILPSINQVNTPSVSNAARIAENITLTNSTATAAKFGATQGTVAFTGGFGSVSASIVSWGDTSITVTVPVAISDTIYLGDITITRAADANSKTATAYGGNTFRVLPRTLATSPTSGIVGDIIQITGNHFCQTGTCPVSPNRSSAADNVKFGATQALDADFINQTGGAGACNGTGAAWNHAELCVKVPAGTPAGSQPVTVTSNSFASDTEAFTRASSAPNDPTNLYQFKTNTDTAEPPTTNTATGNGINQANVWFRMTMSAGVSTTLAAEVEVQPIGTAFLCSGTGACASAVTGTGVAFTVGTPVKGFVQVTGLTSGTSYHWQGRVKNTGTTEWSSWISFGGNTENPPTNPAATDFYIDTTAPTISVGTPPSCTSHTGITASGATISWSPSDTFSTTFTKQVEYSTDSNLVGSICKNTTTETCGTPGSGTNANPQTIALTGLSSNTTYYYRVRSKDIAGNEALVPSAAAYCSFTTSKANTKSLEYFVRGETAALPFSVGGNPQTFQATISETGYVLQDVFVEISGIANTGTSLTLSVKVYGATEPAYTNYIIPISATVTTPFTILHKVDPTATGLYIAPTSSSLNTLKISPGSGEPSISIASAKIIITYYAPPQ